MVEVIDTMANPSLLLPATKISEGKRREPSVERIWENTYECPKSSGLKESRSGVEALNASVPGEISNLGWAYGPTSCVALGGQTFEGGYYER